MKHRAIYPLMQWACALVLMLPALAAAAEDIDSTHEIPADGLVQVENVAGSVEFSVWDRNEVQVRGRVGDDVEEVDIESTGRGLRVVVRNEKNARNIDPTHLHLKVPIGASIDAEGVSADLTISGSKGESLRFSTVSGDVEVDAETGRVELSSVSGDVEFDGLAERVMAESVSGDVVLLGVEGEVEAKTVSGDVTMEAGQIARGRFETVSGEIVLELELASGGRLTCDAMSGDIKLKLPGSQEAGFTAQSFSGSIHSDFGKATSVSKGPGTMLKAQIGEDDARIRLETFSGDISIRSQ